MPSIARIFKYLFFKPKKHFISFTVAAPKETTLSENKEKMFMPLNTLDACTHPSILQHL